MPTPTRSVPSRVTSATALRLVATRHQHAGRDLASTPPPVGFALSAAPRSARPAHCSRYLRPYAPRSYSGLPCAREHLPHTGGDFSHDQPADGSTAARSPSMVCSANVTRFALASGYTSRCIRMYHRHGGANQRGGRRQAHRPGHAPLRTADEARSDRFRAAVGRRTVGPAWTPLTQGNRLGGRSPPHARDEVSEDLIVVDTSAWVDFFQGRTSTVASRLERLIEVQADVAITETILMEVLAGATGEALARIRAELIARPILRLEGLADFEEAAQ